MSVDFPQDIGSVQERLARLEDAALARDLMRKHPMHFPGAVVPPSPLARVRRFGMLLLALVAAGSLVGSTFLLPLIAQRSVEKPHVTVSVEHPEKR